MLTMPTFDAIFWSINVGAVYMEVSMRVFYLYDEDGPDRREAGSALAAWAAERGHELVSRPAPALKPCLGCFGCWVKTPGRCVIKADAEEAEAVIRDFLRSDLVVLGGATPFGCYSPALKAAVDRMLPVLLPYFRRFRGEMHHVPRYARMPRIVSAGFGEASEAEDATYLELARAFCDNAASPRQKRAFRYGGDGEALVEWIEGEAS
jgi:multimeric flavodoxin WrbA